MNKLATKEPSMDEILSSIRQIIADDDAATTMPSVPKPPPLALSPSQIVTTRQPPPLAAPEAALEAALPEPELDDAEPEPLGATTMLELVDPEDVAFAAEPALDAELEPIMSDAQPTPPVAEVAPMPDADLSRDLAEQILAPTTDAAVRSAMAKLRGVTQLGVGSQTIEGILRELLRGMLKEWLDEHLPAMVEHIVEEEIVRISRGLR